jgi:arsenate reductase (thioredoxin)
MAEGWAHYLGSDQIEALSAGIEAHGKNLLAIRVMREAGVDISGQESTKLTDELLASTDYLITVCGHADENCPVLPAGIRKEHWPLDDPAKATSSDNEVLAVFRKSRDDIRRRVEDLLARLQTIQEQSDDN